jgi:hypothetical protein
MSAIFTLPLGLGACGSEFDDGQSSFEEVGAVTEAVETASRDTPAAAAVEVFLPGTVGSALDYHGYIFACDEDNKLRRAIVSDNTGGISPWQTFITDCRGVPTAGLYGGTGSSSVVLYTRRADGHLWEAWWPNILNDSDNPIWTDLSAWTGLGSITGSPMLVNSDSNGHLSVVVRKPSTNELYSVDYCGDDWVDRKVINSGSTAIRSANSVTGRGLDNWGNYQVMGRGLTSSDDATGWLARKDDCAESYVRVASLDITTTPTGFGGTPFPAYFTEFIPFTNEHRFARFNDRLKRFSTGPGGSTGAWTNVGECRINGSVRGAANPGVKENFSMVWTRGGDTTDHTDDLMLVDFPNVDCESVGNTINMQSAPTAFEHATRSTFTHSVVYRGGSGKVNFYRADINQNTSISGLFLP